MSILDAQEGEVLEIYLAVLKSEVKMTKNNSPYLLMELTDGMANIRANVWDWGKPAVQTNIVLFVKGCVEVFNGTKQLRILTMRSALEKDVTEFAPQGYFNIHEYIQGAKNLIEKIEHKGLNDIIHDLYFSGDFEQLWRTVPAALRNHHAYLAGTLQHSVDVANIARNIAQYHRNVNMDLLTAGAMVHDIGKLFTYKWEGITIEMTNEGKLLDHLVIGFRVLQDMATEKNRDLIQLLQHMILSHHGNLEWGSPVTPVFKEAYILHMADMLDSRLVTCEDAERVSSGEWTQKVFSMNNRELLNRQYIDGVLSNT